MPSEIAPATIFRHAHGVYPSMAMLADKVRHVLDTGAEVCSSGDNSCLMNIGGALHRERTGVHTVHLAEILASTEREA